MSPNENLNDAKSTKNDKVKIFIVRVNKPGDKNHGKTVEVQGFLLWRKTPTYSVRIDGCDCEYPVSHLEHVDGSNALRGEEEKNV